MSTTEQRLAANRANALGSTGPTTLEGKAVSCRNATRHGLLSSRLLLDDESADDFAMLASELCDTLGPVGMIEELLVERIAVSIWRQRRLVQAETASLTLTRQPRKIAGGVASELGRTYGAEIKAEELQPFNVDQERWCRSAVAEIDGLETLDLASVEQHAPHVLGQLQADAASDKETVELHIAAYEGGLPGYVARLMQWCREQIREADARPRVLALAEQVRAKRVVLPSDALELMARYQTTLDNQLYKALRALREAQEWRLKTLDASPAQTGDGPSEMAEAA